MRIISSVILSIAVIGIWELNPLETIHQDEEVSSFQSDEIHLGVDQIITGVSIPKDHLIEWEKNKKRLENCQNCITYSQPFPADVDFATTENLQNHRID